MTNVFTLDAIREETERRYAPTEFVLSDGEKVEIKSYLRLGKKDRDAIVKYLDEISNLELDDDAGEEEVELWADEVSAICAKVIKLVADSPRKLIEALEHEDPRVKANLFTTVINSWVNGDQVGEA